MSIGITQIAFEIRQASLNGACVVKLSHAQQLAAAALGYQTFASYQAATSQGLEAFSLETVPNIVLDQQLLTRRCSQLALEPLAATIVDGVVGVFEKLCPGRAVYRTSEGFLEVLIREAELELPHDAFVVSALAKTMASYVDEVHLVARSLTFGLVPSKAELTVTLDGHVELRQDVWPPFARNRAAVHGALSIVRLGLRCFGGCQLSVQEFLVDAGSAPAMRDHDEYDNDGEPPVRSMAQALAEELGLDLEDAQELTAVEIQDLDGSSGEMTYSHLLDFTDIAPPEIAEKIIARHGSLQVEVSVNAFDGVRGDDWPN